MAPQNSTYGSFFNAMKLHNTTEDTLSWYDSLGPRIVKKKWVKLNFPFS